MRYGVAKVTETLDKPQISDLDVEHRFRPAHRGIIGRGAVSSNQFTVAILLHSLLRLCHHDTCCYTSRPESKSPSRRDAGKDRSVGNPCERPRLETLQTSAPAKVHRPRQ